MNLSIRRRAATLIDMLVGVGVVAMCLALIMPATYSSQQQSRLRACTNNLKMIGLALQNFHDIRREICPSYLTNAQDDLPAGYVAWPVLLMPYMEQVKVYELFDLRHPLTGDNPNTRATGNNPPGRAISIPSYFCPMRRTPPQMTTDNSGAVGDYANVSYGMLGNIVDPAKPKTFNGAMMVSRAFNPSDKPAQINGIELGPSDFRAITNFASIIDGLSNTAFVAEKMVHQDRMREAKPAATHQDGTYYYGSGGAVQGKSPLTDPGPMAYWSRRLAAVDANTPILPREPRTEDPNNRFGGWHGKVTLVSLGDGSVRVVPNSTSNTPLELFGARNDRQAFDLPRPTAAEQAEIDQSELEADKARR